MDSLTITIGRNIGTEPMDEIRWRAFKLHIVAMAMNTMPDTDRLLFSFTGQNEWNGIAEESFMVQVVGTFNHPADVTSARLEETLGFPAYWWEQDAIAFSIGKSTLATQSETAKSIIEDKDA